jgi:hypothetical protein
MRNNTRSNESTVEAICFQPRWLATYSDSHPLLCPRTPLARNAIRRQCPEEMSAAISVFIGSGMPGFQGRPCNRPCSFRCSPPQAYGSRRCIHGGGSYSDPTVPCHADAVHGGFSAGHVLAHVIALTIEFVSIVRVTPKIQVVSLFRVTASAAVLRHWFDNGLRFRVICHDGAPQRSITVRVRPDYGVLIGPMVPASPATRERCSGRVP